MFEEYLKMIKSRPPVYPDRRIRISVANCGDLLAGVFEPSQDADIIYILFHGAGANMNAAGYFDLAFEINKLSGAGVLVPDIRGHGISSGDRGYTPYHTDVWDDLDLWIAEVVNRYPNKKIVLAGHSAGAAMILNRVTRHQKPIREEVRALAMIAPYLITTRLEKPPVTYLQPQGSNSVVQTNIIDDEECKTKSKATMQISNFSQVDISVFLAHFQNPNGPYSQKIAVRFNYPDELKKVSRLVAGYTPEMAIAMSPQNVIEQLTSLELPTLIVIADKDVLFSKRKIIKICENTGNAKLTLVSVPEDHLTCLYTVAPKIVQGTKKC